jgi:hypothetical protein
VYLKRLHIENNGPLRKVDLELPFTSDLRPKPVILVGGNGSGKTNLLSIIADALFEAAAQHYLDVVPGMSPMTHSWFRVVGASTISVGAPCCFAILQFEHEGASYLFKEKGGRLPAGEVSARLSQELASAAAWPDEGSFKEFTIGDELVGKIFEEGIYAYFPSSRAEAPHWLNRESLPTAEFDTSMRVTKRLRKPIYVERSLEKFQQWLLGVLFESRSDVNVVLNTGGIPHFQPVGNLFSVLASRGVVGLANQILCRILGDQNVYFAWLGRQGGNKLGIAAGGVLKVPTIEALSAGQSTLLGIFGTILRYADHPRWQGNLPAGEVAGICVVDEIDAHMHIDLQYRALPELIRLFPRVQFVVSSHSPLFVLGMEKVFGGDGIVIIDMPSGTPIQAEAYAEFGRALEVLQDTKAFAAEVAKAVATPGKLLVLTEGETDPIYLRTAAELLGHQVLLDNVEFDWVGAKDPKSGRTFHTGKDALNHTLSVLRAKPDLVKRRILLLYDNDTNKPSEDHSPLYVRSMPSNPANDLVEAGIENLLSPAVFLNEMFEEKTIKKRNGGTTITTSLRKMTLCTNLCNQKRDPSDFAGFLDVLNLIEAFVESGSASQSLPAAAESTETGVL